MREAFLEGCCVQEAVQRNDWWMLGGVHWEEQLWWRLDL